MGKIYLFSAIIFILFSFSKQVSQVWKTISAFIFGLIPNHVIKLVLITLFIYGNSIIAQISTIPFTTVGTSTWTCPSGVTTITVQCRGGGGGGGGVNNVSGAASGGGSGGSFSSNTITVVPGTTYSVTVGAGGTAGANTGGNGGVGGSSSFSLTTIVAVGGSGGTGASTAVGAAGGVGTTTGNTAGTNFAGGNGAAGTVSTIGGGAGGGAGDANPGGNASGSTAGTGGVAGGGNGGAGTSNAVGGAGVVIGGGGGGTRSSGVARAGGAGARGQVTILYTNPPVVVENFPNQTFCTSTFTTAYNTVNFSLIETAATNFDASQTSQTIVLTLPAGFAFNTAAGPTVTRNTAAPGQDITIVGFSWTTSAITVTVTTAATQNNIDEINFNNFQVQATAALSGDLVRTGGTFKVNGSAGIPASAQSFGHLATSAPSVYNSSSVNQYSTANIIRGCTFTGNPILEIQVNITGGSCSPADAITQFVFSTVGNAGSTNAATDITKAEIYYADTTQGFSNANFYGSVNNPNGTFTITGSQPLNLGSKTYYFYLSYVVPATATIGDMVDASMSSFVFNGSSITNMSTPNPAGGRSIVSGTCLNAGDAAPPVAKTQTITAGSLIIPMDNTHQALVAPFNLKAYGLVHQLLLNDIPVKWVIKSGKAKDAADFIANAGQIYPTVVAAASQTFVASEFVVDSFWVDHSFYPGGQTATQVMTSFATPNSVAVYSLTADVVVDVRYTLNHRPKIAVFSNGGNQAIQTTMLTAAGITSNVFVQDAGDFTGLASCYTFCSESHWDFSKNPDVRPVQRVMDFVHEGGNFLAQCAGIDLYENHQPSSGHFQTTNGVSFANTTQTNTDYNADMAFCQYQGTVTPQTGTIASFWLPAGSTYKPEMFYGVSTPAATNSVVASAAHLADPDSVGSNVFYLGGHQYAVGTIGNDNGIRMYLNATLVPAHRPTAFPIVMSSPTICAGQTVTIGPSVTAGANYIWSPATNLSDATICNPVASPTNTSVYSLTGFNGGCIMGPSTMTVNVKPTPSTPIVGSNSPLCSGTTLSLTAVSSGTNTYNWSGPNSYTSTTQNPSIANVTTTNSGTYSVTATSNSCTSAPGSVSVSISAPPATPTAGSNSPVCQGQTINLTASAIAGATYSWSGPNSYTSTSQNPSLTGVLAAAGVYSVTATVAGCVSSISTVTVVVNTTPVMTSVSSASVCGGVAVNIPLTSSVGGSTFTWLATDNINTTGESTTSQTTNTLSNTIVNNTASVQTIIYTVTPTAAGCVGTSQTVTITVNPVPVMTNTNSATICSAGTVNIPLTDNVGSTYTWIAADNLNTTGESTTLQTTNTLNNTITNNIVSAQNVIYSVTPTSTSGGCVGTSQSITVTVNSTPSATASPSSQSICSNNVTAITLTSNVAGSTFAWTVNQTGVSGASASTGTLIAQTLTATSTSTGSASYTITPTAGSCAGVPVIVNVTVTPIPSVTATPSSQTICSNNATAITLTSNIAGSTFAWTVSQTGISGGSASTGSVIAQTLSTTGTTLGTAVYNITPSANSCNGAPIVVTVSVNPTPTITATPGTQTLCSGNASSISLTSNVAGTTFSWTVTQTNVTGATAASGASIAQTLSTTTTSSGTAVYSITSSANSCGGNTQTVTVTVNPTPVMTSTNAGVICSAGTITIPLTSNVASGYTWIAADNVNTTGESTTLQSSNSINNTITNNTTIAQIVVYTVTPTSTSGSCVGAAQVVSVTVNPAPSVTATPSSQSLCSGNATSITLTGGVAGTTYSWTVSQIGISGASASTGTSIAQTLSTTGTTLGTAVYTITPSANSCIGSSIVVTVSVNPTPTITATPGTQTLCSGSASNISLTSNVAGTTFSWTVTQTNVTGASAASGASIAQTLSTTTTSSGTVVYTITSSANSCGGSTQTVTVTVNPTPVMTSTNAGVICSAGTITIPLTSNVASGYTWIAADNVNTTGESTTLQSSNSINNTITNNTTSAQIVVYTVTPMSTAGSCVGAVQVVSVTVNPMPAMTSTNAAVVCSGSTFSINLTSNVASTYTWIATNNVNTVGESLTTQTATTLANTITNSTTSSQIVTYTVTPTTSAGNCAGVSQVINVAVNPTPVMTSTNAGAICSLGTITIPLTSNVASGYTWIAADNVNTTGESTTLQSTNSINNTITNNTTNAQVVVYTVTPTSSAGSCVGAAQVVSVTVNAIPTLTSATTATICSGGTVVLPLSSNVSANYSWIATDNLNTTGESLTAQNTATINNTIISSVGTTENVLYNVTPTSVAGSCVGATKTLTVTISPTPIVTLTPSSQVICSGSTATIALSSNVAGTTYSWTVSQSNTSGASAGTGTIISQALTATGLSAGIATYTVTPGIGTCSGSSSVGTITVNPIATVTATPSSQVLCSGNTTAINLSSNVSGTTYSWTVSQTNVSGASASTGSVIAQNLTTTTSSQGTVTYTISSTNNGCAGIPVIVTVSVNPIPTLSVTPTSQAFCTGSTTSLTLSSNVAGTTYSWTVSQTNASGGSAGSGTLIAQTITATSASVGTVVYSVTPTAASCLGTLVVATVSVSPIPATPTPTNNGPICVNGSLNLSVGTIAGASYNWTGPNGFTSAVQNPTITNIPFAGAGVYTVNVTVNGCTGPNKTTTVVVNPPPPTTLTASSNSPLCSSQTLSLTVAPVAAATYSWAGPNSFSSTLQNPTITNASTLTTGVYSITATVSGCGSSGTQTVSVIVNQTPVAPIATNNGPLCVGATLSLTASGAATTYSWTGPGGYTNNNQNPTITNIVLTQAGTYSVSATTNGCTGAIGTTTVVVNPIPATPIISTNAPVCVGQTVNLTTGVVAGATYNWSGPNTFTSSVQNPSITNASTVQAGTYSLSVIVSGCASATGTINVGVNNAASSPTVSSNSPVCSTDTIHLSAISSVGSTYSWTGPNGFTSTAQNPFIANATVLANGTYTVIANNGCASTPALVTVSVTPKPSVPVVSSNSPICDGGTLNLTASNTGTSYSWSGPSSYTSSVQNPTITPATLASAGVYSVIASANGCSSNTRTVNIVVNPIPATPVVGNNSPVCTGQSFNLTVTPVAGASYGWSGPNSYTSSVQSPTVTNVTLSQAGTYSLIITVNGCSSTTAAVTTVTINSTPTIPTVTNNGPLCVGATLNLTASGAATTYSWTGPSGFTDSNQNPTVTNITLSQAGTYSVSATTNGCTSAIGTTTVVVNPIPVTPTISTNAPVCVGQTVNLTTGVVAGATYNWSGPNTFTSSVQNPSITNASTVQAGTYSLSVVVNGCTSATGTINIGVNNAASSPTVSSNSPVCSGDTLFLSVISSVGSTYSWSGPNSFTSTAQNPFIANTTTLVSGSYTVIANNGCASTPAVVTVTVNQTPATPTVTSNSPVCSGNTLNLSATLLAGGNYNWSGPNGFTATTQNTSVSNMTPAEQGTYSVTVTKNGCTSLVANTNVTVTIPPIANAGVNTTVCANNASVTLTGTVSGGSSTGIWTSTGSGIFAPNANSLNTSYIPSNADTTAGSVVLTLSSTNNGGCSASTSSITVTITKAPVALAGSNATVCANNANVNLNGIVYGGSSTGIWTTSGSGTFNPNATTLNAIYVPSAADITSGNVSFTLTTTGNGQCFAASSQMTATITPAPTTHAGPDQITCKATPNAALSGTVTVTNNGTWTTLGSGTFNPNATVLNPTYIPSTADTAAGSVLLVLTSSNNGSCLPVTDTVKISFSNIPTVNAGISQTVCANNAMVALNGTITGGGSSGIWTSSGTGTFVPNATALNASYIPSAADTTARSVTFTLTSTSGCVVVTDQVSLAITPAPFVSAGVNISVCSNNALANYNGSVSGVTTTGIWSTTGSGSFSPNNTTLSGSYTPSAADISAGSAYLILTSNNNGNCNATIDSLRLTITPPPTAFAGNDTSICASNSLVLNGVITGGAGTGAWTTSGSGTFNPNATTLNASYIPSAADTTAHQVVLTLTSTNNGGCLAATDNLTLTITPAPSVNAGVNQTICSANSVVTLTGQVTVASGLHWTSLGDGTFGSANATSTSYTIGTNDITNGQVKIIATSTGNGNCVVAKDTMIITIEKAPVVNAGVNQFVCQGNMVVTVAGSVVGTTSTGVWSTLGTGTFGSSTSLNTTYTLSTADTTAGSVKLVLASTNNGTCNQVTDTVLISVTPAGFAMSGNDTTICSSDTMMALSGVIFGGTGAGQWSSSGTGTFTPSNTALNATYVVSAADIAVGHVSIKLTPINSCLPHADSLIITINPKPIVNAGTDQTICSSVNTVTLNGNVSGGSTTGVWTTMGTGSFSPNALSGVYNVSSGDSLAGSVKLVLTSTNNGICNAVNDTVKIFITNSTSAIVGNDTTICSIDSLALAGNIIGGSLGQWTSHGTGVFHPSNTALNATYIPSATDITNGSVIIKLTPTTGCQVKADSLTLTFNLAPIVNAGADISVCISTKTVALSGTVSGGSTTGIWTTSGSGIFLPNDSTLNSTYQLSSADSTAGIVTLFLTSTHSGGCGAIKDSLVINMTTPGFAFVNNSMVVCGNNASAVLSGTITGGTGQGLWTSSGSGTFNPLNTSMTPTYVPSAADVTNGSVTIKLTPSNACSPTADSFVLTITPSPTVSAGADVFMCGGLAPINLSGSTNTVSTGAIWTTNGTGTFNPNNTTLNASYVPSVSDGDTLVFVLTTTGNGLCNAAFDSMFVYRNVKPISNFTYTNPCAGQVVTFTDSSIVGAGTITSWTWNFGNGNTSAVQNPTNSFSVAGTYSVSLLINTSQGCSDSITKVLTIHPSPVPSFSFATSCSNDSVRFVNSSSIASGTISAWSWNFGDTHVSTLQNPAHLFDSIKVYNVSLVVTSDLGCVSTITQTLSVIPAPIAGFSLQSTCGSLIVNFKDTTIVNSGTITNWNWTFGDGHVATTQNPSNTYSATGAFTVTLQVQTSNGCKDTASVVINLSPSILADYTPHGGAYHISEEIAFTNQSTGATSYVWNFGDGSSTSTTTDPTHAFGSSGSYSVILIASNGLGCVDTVAYMFDVKTSGYTVPEGFTPNGDGINDGFFVLGGPFSVYDLRVFNEWGNQIFSSNSQSDKWDGTYKGSAQPAGTYVFIFNGKIVDGDDVKLKGEVNLIR